MRQMEKIRPTGRQIAAARTLLGMTQPQLSTQANISAGTLKRMEASEGEVVGMANNVAAVVSALEKAGVEFMNGGEPGVKLRKRDPGATTIPLEDLNAENDE